MRNISVTTEWVVIPGIDPEPCKCGHLHYARREHTQGGGFNMLAPQWTWCEEESCTCRALQKERQ